MCDLPTGAIGGSWNADDVIVVGQPSGGLLRCPAGSGVVSEVTRLDAAKGENVHLLPSFLPDGRHFLYREYIRILDRLRSRSRNLSDRSWTVAFLPCRRMTSSRSELLTKSFS